MKIREKYECDHCGQEFVDKVACIDHEECECVRNPRRKKCGSCRFAQIGFYNGMNLDRICLRSKKNVELHNSCDLWERKVEK